MAADRLVGMVGAITLLIAGAARADVTISKQPTENMSCQVGVCSPTASKAVLNATDLANMLAGGDVKVTTGSGATNIVVKDSLGWASTSRLTLDAIQSVEIDKPVMVTGTGAVTVTTNDGGTGGDLIFDGKGNVTFWDLNSGLIVNGNSYTLAGDITTLASDIANNPSGFYALANDYDASVDGTYTSNPIATELTGTFEGLGHAISNLTINSADLWIGLFANANGTLRDIGLVRLAISGTGSVIGGLLGESHFTNIVGCYATGSITMGNATVVGGLVGQSNSADSDGQLIRSHTDVRVTAPIAAAAGGLVGESSFNILLSYAIGSVEVGDNGSAGGLIGDIGGSVSQSFATGKVKGGANSEIGGLVGSIGGTDKIDNSYATGSVKGGDSAFVGGLLGEGVEAYIESSYSTGHVAGKESGGFLGRGIGNTTFWNYWDTDSSGKPRRRGCDADQCPHGIKGLTTEQFQSGLPEGFDPAIWGQKKNINGGYPYLQALPPH